MHPEYNRSNYPRLVWDRRDSNWGIYAAPSGRCAAIPWSTASGALPSHFGDLAYVARLKRSEGLRKLGRASA